MTELTTLWLVWDLSEIQTKKLEYQLNLEKLKNELESSMLMIRIRKWEEMLKQLNEKENELKSKWLELLNKSNIDKFESNWVQVRKKTSIWKLIIDNEDEVPKDYIKTETKTITKINKNEIKNDLKQGVIVPWVHLEQDVTLEIKYL